MPLREKETEGAPMRTWWKRRKAVSSILRILREYNAHPPRRVTIWCSRKVLNLSYDHGGKEEVEKAISGLIRMAEEEEKLEKTIRNELRWGIRLVHKETGRIPEPTTEDVRRLRFLSKERASDVLGDIFSQRRLEFFEWRVVELAPFQDPRIPHAM